MAASPSMDLSNFSDDMLQSPVSGIAFDVEVSDCNGSPLSVPKRVRRRLLEALENRSRSPASLQDIETKLKEADLRRQQFHEWLANKARPKARSPSRSPQPEDLAQRLEAKLVAAEQKRMELLSQEQTRLARLHELRTAAKTEVQLRAEKEREELESKVESRVQQAETNRLALLEAERQRWAAIHERMAQSIVQRTTQEDRDRERVEALRAMIFQKIAAAEEKRAGRLKAETSRAQATVLQARRVAKSVLRERELESRKLRENLEARLQRAKRQRAEYLRQRGGCQGATHNNRHKMHKHGDRLCRKLTRCWRQFRHSRRTTFMLAQEFAACDINQQSVTSLPFEQLAARITSPTSLRSVKALLARIESRLLLSSASQSNVAKIDHLLKRLAPHKKNGSANGARVGKKSGLQGSNKGWNKEAGKAQSTTTVSKGKDVQRTGEKELERYPARVFLCAYMIIGHPEAVFSSRGEREVALSEAAAKLLPEFEALVSTILDGPPSNLQTGPSSPDAAIGKKFTWDSESPTPQRPFTSQLAAFDAAWCSYLYQFVAWKVQDAQMLEEDLIRVACQLEMSMLQKCKITCDEDGADLSHDSKAIRKQVLEDQQLLQERVLHLTGAEGVARMEEALSEARAKFTEARETGSPLPSPFSSPQKPRAASSPVTSSPENFILESKDETCGVPSLMKAAQSLFKSSDQMDEVFEEKAAIHSGPESVTGPLFDDKGLSNDKLVNEMLHEPDWATSNAQLGASKSFGKLAEIQAQIKVTMEDAFWNGVAEALIKDSPDYGRITGLFKEVRAELEALVPEGWKQELYESMDIDIFSQVLESGFHDYNYFRRLFDYALSIVLKLGAPARDSDARTAHEALVQELSEIASQMGDQTNSSFAHALVKGLRFVLEQIQVLKTDISAVRIQALTPLIQGSAGIEYLQNAFAKYYQLSICGSDQSVDILQKLPKTTEWLMEVGRTQEQERNELEALLASVESVSLPKESMGLPPVASMRTGSRIVSNKEAAASIMKESPSSSSTVEPRVLQWKSASAYVRLGLLYLVCRPEAVTDENVAETFRLNVHRLRKGQNEFQRIVIIATGLLLLRQGISNAAMSGVELENILKSGSEQINALLDRPVVTIPQIGLLLAEISGRLSHDSSMNMAANSELMTRVLSRSLSPDNAIFTRVSAAVRVGLRAIFLLGKGTESLALANSALQRIGATCLLDLVVALANYMERLASVSCKVHEPWYTCIVGTF